jgi:hypothetical protein
LKQLAECRGSILSDRPETPGNIVVSKKGNLFTELMTRISVEGVKAGTTARRVVDELYPYCGMPAADPKQKLTGFYATSKVSIALNRN